MAELILERNERLRLRGEAHHLNALVLIGEKGLTDAVMREIDRALDNHGLIKVHVAGDEREEREEIYTRVADELGAARVQAIGKMLVFFRPQPESRKEKAEDLMEKLRAKAEPDARGIKKTAARAKKSAPVGKPSSAKDAKRKSRARAAVKRTTKKSALS